MAWSDQLNAFQQQLDAQRGQLDEELKKIDSAWSAAQEAGSEAERTRTLRRLAEMHRAYSYLARFTDQIRERLVRLSF